MIEYTVCVSSPVAVITEEDGCSLESRNDSVSSSTSKSCLLEEPDAAQVSR